MSEVADLEASLKKMSADELKQAMLLVQNKINSYKRLIRSMAASGDNPDPTIVAMKRAELAVINKSKRKWENLLKEIRRLQ